MNDKTIDQIEESNILPHHEQLELCRTRPAYRQGRELTAVKVYSISGESNHLLVFGVPRINLRKELKVLFQKFGKILSITVKNYNPIEEFTECFHIVYDRFQSARIAKKRLDAKNFYGGNLHICYAPELETLDETKNKLFQRRNYVRKQASIISQNKIPNKTFVKSTTIESNIISFDNYLLNNQSFLPTNYPLDASNKPSTSFTIERDEGLETNISNKISGDKRQRECDDNQEYVFKRNKKKKKSYKTFVKQMECNDFNKVNKTDILKEDEDRGECSKNLEEKVVVYDKLDVPKVVNLPKKTANKIILKINTKLI